MYDGQCRDDGVLHRAIILVMFMIDSQMFCGLPRL
jgi:hypothetical protein